MLSLLHYFPSSIYALLVHLIVLVGTLGIFAGDLVKYLSFVNPYLKYTKTVGYILLVLGIYLEGCYATEMMWRKKVEEVQQKVLIAEEKARTASAQVEIKYINKVQYIHDVKYKTKEVIREVASKIDAECKVDPSVINIHNTEAQNVYPKIDLTK